MTSVLDDCEEGFDPMAVHLSHGSHNDFRGECCAIEWSNRATVLCPTLAAKYGKAEKFSDDHPSISRVIRSFVIGLNDNWNDRDRQRLRPYVVGVLGTNTGAKDETTRAWMATDWLARVQCPAFLRLAKLDEHARILEGLARIVDAKTARLAQPSLDAARSDAAAARDAAWAAARAAAWVAAWAAAWAAAGDAAWAAAKDAAWAAARAAAGAATGAAARDAARDAAWAAASAATGAAARAAAGDAARDALTPTVKILQASSLTLLDEMIAVGAHE